MCSRKADQFTLVSRDSISMDSCASNKQISVFMHTWRCIVNSVAFMCVLLFLNLKLGKKFGAGLDRVPHLLSLAKRLDLNVVGIRYTDL